MWEISAPTVANTANAFNDLGYAYARPEVARLADGRWAAFISNGYGSNSGVAALYVVDIRDGSLIRKIVINSSETGNGLSSVKLRVNSQNVVQAAYGGDLKGRMWKFDLSGTSPTAWGVAFAGQPLFTTSGGATQPITVQPLLADNPQGGTQVFFGTGKFNETADKLNKDLQGFYSIWDATGGAGQITVSSLQAQSITGVFSGSTGQFVTTSQTDVAYPTKKGLVPAVGVQQCADRGAGDQPGQSGERARGLYHGRRRHYRPLCQLRYRQTDRIGCVQR